MAITKADLAAVASLDEAQGRSESVIGALGTDPACWLRFLSRYTTWNRCFGSAVAMLAGRIGRARDAFVDDAEALPLLNDRSVVVASWFFDAARDEFNDRETKNHRDTHRCLAQALVKGFIEVQIESGALTTTTAAAQLDEPIWLKVIQARVFSGYGDGYSVERPFLFRSMGYHLGSEVLADQEFTIIDRSLRKHMPAVVEQLLERKVRIGDQEHTAYQWLRIHSSLGNAVEADHFAWAIKGVDEAFRYSPKGEHQSLKDEVLAGFVDFSRDQRAFFAKV
ncbi:MAG: hypothetical protein Q8O67_00625 [Deltaproteobacteria bacterium]|nr:hypothetical protein [Deltaproteobacteria bacterium]